MCRVKRRPRAAAGGLESNLPGAREFRVHRNWLLAELQVLRVEDDLAVGNIVGSNLFNTLAVVGVAGAITPMPEIERMVVVRDLPASLALALFLAAASWFGRKSGNPAALIGRKSGIVLLAFYTLYICFLTVGATSR